MIGFLSIIASISVVLLSIIFLVSWRSKGLKYAIRFIIPAVIILLGCVLFAPTESSPYFAYIWVFSSIVIIIASFVVISNEIKPQGWCLVLVAVILFASASTFFGWNKSEPDYNNSPSTTKCAWCEKRDASFGSKYCSRCKEVLKDIY